MKRVLRIGCACALGALALFGAHEAVAGSADLHRRGSECAAKTTVAEIAECWIDLYPEVSAHEFTAEELERLRARDVAPATVASATHGLWLWKQGRFLVYIIIGDAEGHAVKHGKAPKSSLDELIAPVPAAA